VSPALTRPSTVHTISPVKISYDAAAKNDRNIRERGLSFERVVEFEFATANICEDVRKIYPERRFVAVGWLDARVHVLCFSLILDGVRVISFRKTNRREQRDYERT
jgi:uncharacterized DUF497 family protein